MELILGTGNPGKIKELRSLLAGTGVDILSPAEIDLKLKVRESGLNYLENAVLKARAYAAAGGRWALADDTGLEVDPLEGAPGLFSARYAPGTEATDADRRAHLLDNLQGYQRPWKAHFVCTVALAHPSGDLYHTRGICRGEIIPEERGERGFGYDPVFLISEAGKTMAELSLEEKNQLSHRARAVKAILPQIIQIRDTRRGRQSG